MSDRKLKETKEPKDRKMKTPEELAIAHAAKIEYAVAKAEKWLQTLEKVAKSRKYPITPEDSAKIVGYVGDYTDAFITHMTATGPTEAKKFTLH